MLGKAVGYQPTGVETSKDRARVGSLMGRVTYRSRNVKG